MNLVESSEISAGGRITVDLTLFFQDFKKYCVVYLDYNRMKTVQDLKYHIENTFNLKQQFILMLEDCLLLENDNLRVLRNGDHIWLADPKNFVPVESSSRAIQSLKQTPTTNDDTPDVSNNSTLNSVPTSASNLLNGHSEQMKESERETNSYSKKRKHITEECVTARKQETDIENHSKKKKKQQVSKQSLDAFEEESDTSAEEATSASLKTKFNSLVQNNSSVDKTKSISSKSYIESKQRENSEEEQEFDWNSVPLPKRKRIRKRRSKKPQNKPVTSTVSLSVELPKQSMPCIPPAIKLQKAGRVHIRFEEEKNDGDKTPNCEEMQTDETYSLKHVQPKDLIPPRTEHNNQQSVDLSQLLSIKKPFIFERKREQIAQETLDVQTKAQINTWDKISDEDIWKCPTITEAPKVDDFVAFKVLHLSGDYTPQLSCWILARVITEQSVDKGKLALEIQRGSNPFYRDTTGKFEVEKTEDEQEENLMKIDWQEMITPRNITKFK